MLAGFVASSRRVPANPAEPAPDRTISAVSLNMAKESDPDTVMRAIHSAPRLRDADLFLLQEVATQEGTSSVTDEIARKFGYFAWFEPAARRVYDQGLALISRYPIRDVQITHLKACDLRFHCRNRFAIGATVRTPWGDLRVWNTHLDTRINAEERVEQLQPVIDEASRYTGPQLIGGDFNTNDLYWLRNMVPLPRGPSHAAAIRNAMQQHGFETPFQNTISTFPVIRRHLDWIFVRELKHLASSVEPTPFSDHNAVWARLGL
jgi:endonuclease/exonuclease/phosphatase family metal-dependent hydrolase